MSADYPTEEDLQKILNWSVSIPEADKNKPIKGEPWYPFFDFVESIWWCADWGFRREGNVYYLSTGGWSGNESIIDAMQSNFVFWAQWWEQTRRGGHYIFRHMNNDDDENDGREGSPT